MKPKILTLPPQKHGVHFIQPRLLDHRVRVYLVGAGGNGSQMLSGLARLHMALVKLGHPGGLHVTLYDGDLVSESNVGRQLFYPGDIGTPKAHALINRVNLAYGLDWRARAEMFGFDSDRNRHLAADIIITCVDTAAARREVNELLESTYTKPAYWLDLGNHQRDGQVILGQPVGSISNGVRNLHNQSQNLLASANLDLLRLPCVTDIFPELLDASIPEDNQPSCSLAEALQKQDLFINQAVSTFALQLLWRLFREGKIDSHGAFINLESGRVNPLMVPATVGAQKRKRRAA